ncbi:MULTISPECIES: LysR family transcriptional regulator [unclassified Microbacterium]|uniref:LysR family transcriptional regulator n=1 Tax=Microbacterium TaxID=33882 RepID=UPI003BA3D15E
MDVRQLRYFLAIVDHGGFGRAAEQLLISQPSLSQSIASLERELGIELFHRVGRRVTLSAAGEELVGHARVVVRDLESARAAMDAVRGVRTGRVDISSMPSPGIEPLTTIIATFRDRHPEIAISVDGAFDVDDVISAVRSGTSEIGLLGSAVQLRTPGVRSFSLGSQPLVLIVNPADDRFGPGDVIAREQLAGARFIVSQRGALMRTMVDELVASGIDVEIVVEVAHRTSILPLVIRGIGHAVMPASWTPLAEHAGLRTLRIDPPTLLHVSVISRMDHLSPAARAFLAVAREVAA